MQGRLNSFQKSMLQWTDLHPYNAVHVVRVPGALDLDRLRSVIDGSLEILGLTNLALDRDGAAFAYHGGSTRSEIRIINPGDDAHQELELEIARQINTAFATIGRFNPFRFFVLPVAEMFSIGLVYFHPVADAESIVHLLKRMVEAYGKQSPPGVSDSLDLYPPRFDNLLRRSPRLLMRKIVALPSLMRALGSSCRPPCQDLSDLNNGFALFSLPADCLRSLSRTSKMWGVTVNDLFLALLLKSLSSLAPDRMMARRRRKISVGCIVNLRKDLALDSRRTFGLFLGSFLVSHEVPDEISLKDLARDVWQQTRPIKNHKLYLATAVEMGIARLVASWSSMERRKKLYQKNYPLWGGITNMNLNSLWDGTGQERPLDYFRAVSTGPVTPFVLSITTTNDQIQVGMTYRSTVLTRAQAGRVKAEFLNSLDEMVRST
ncbi:MAG: hypothetical protein H7X97_08985 [Opitutaceae bacterium]|nr:hypothetical protein [Verrucomicrobiales bacterium]